MKEAFDLIRKRIEEKTDFLSDCTKYGNKDAKQQEKSYSTMYMYEIADMVEELVDIVSEVEAEYGNGWIPCSERLPKKEGSYLTTTEYGAVRVNHFYLMHKAWGYRSYKTIAWMPLPEAYKPEKGE